MPWIDKTYSAQISAGTDYVTANAAVASKYATKTAVSALETE